MSSVRYWWATGLGLVALFIALAFWDPALRGGPDLCLFHHITGLACPACGLTRAAAALTKGRFVEAWGWHPLAAPLGFEVLAAWLLWGTALRDRERALLLARVAPRVALLTGAMLLAVWIVRWTMGTLPS